MKTVGMLKVTVLPAFATSTWLAVGAMIIFPAVGTRELTVNTPPVVPDPKAIQTPDDPEYMKDVNPVVFSQRVPLTYALSEVVGSLVAV
jgi:hypothetical protein